MNKKKVCIESLTTMEPSMKMPKLDESETNLGADSIIDDKAEVNATSTPTATLITTTTTTTTLTTNTATAIATKPNVSADGEKDIRKLMNRYIFDDDAMKALQGAFTSLSSYNDDENGIKLDANPFQHCVLPNFISDKTFMAQLEKELKSIKLQPKDNDLYKFKQSSDLNSSKSSTLQKFRSQLQLMKDFLSNVTGIPLTDKIDIFCSHYRYTDVLLCHDDELEDRRIAFIYYLVPETWDSSDGGALDLFDIDDHGQPKNVVKSILPKRNNFLFFEVSAKSFHQVAEVLSEDKRRVSLSGWFHGPTLHRPPPYVEPLPPAMSYGNVEEDVFYSWFNPTYLALEIQADIRERFENDSFIMLSNFLEEEKYAELLSALRSSDIDWDLIGPANKSHILSANKESLPSIAKEYLRVIQSDAFFLVLSHLTGLKLHPMASNEDSSNVNGASSSSSPSSAANDGASNPRCRSVVRKVQHGCYSLAHDTDPEIFEFSLDTMLYLGCGKDWSSKNGGCTSYIGKGDDEVLLTMEPQENYLTLVYRDKDCMRFLKHVNHRVTKLSSSDFYEVNCVYYE